MDNKIVTYCQIALKSRYVSLGDQLIPDIQKKKVYLVLISSNCGRNRLKKLCDKSTYYQIPYLIIDDADLQQVCSRTLSSMGITNKGLANKIIQVKKG